MAGAGGKVVSNAIPEALEANACIPQDLHYGGAEDLELPGNRAEQPERGGEGAGRGGGIRCAQEG